MKYYGIKKKTSTEAKRYSKDRRKMYLRSLIPGKKQETRKMNYKYSFEQQYHYHINNGMPQGRHCRLKEILIADLVSKKDIEELKKGLRKLIQSHRTTKAFVFASHEGLEQLLDTIDKLDSSLWSSYTWTDLGLFDFANTPLENDVEMFSIKLFDTNSVYIGVLIDIHLSERFQSTRLPLIEKDFHDVNGYSTPLFFRKAHRKRGIESYTATHYNDATLKADIIYEELTCFEWEVLEQLKAYFPFALHINRIIPPRIEVFYSDLLLKREHKDFWHSIGADYLYGQQIDRRQTVFFWYDHTERYDRNVLSEKLIYIINDSKTENEPIDSKVQRKCFNADETSYLHLLENAFAYFTFLLANTIVKEMGNVIVKYRKKLNRIKLKRNNLIKLLKTRYYFEKEIELFRGYAEDNNWSKQSDILRSTFVKENYNEDDKDHDLCDGFINGAIRAANSKEKEIKAIVHDFDRKREILQHLSDYRNTRKSLFVSIVALLVAIITLFFVVFPEQGKTVVESIISIIKTIFGIK